MNISSRAKPATDLPSEVLVRILHHCDYKCIIRFSMTCKVSYETVRQSISLQLHIELEVNGLEIPKQSPKVGTSYASILQELKDYRDAWLKFRLSPVVVQRIMGPDILCPHWEIQNGAYIGGFRESEEEYEDDFRFDRIQVSKFYSSTTPPPLHFKKFDHFVADVYQDLVALIDYDADRSVFARVYFYHTVTGQPHPLARLSTFTVRFEDYVDEEPVWGPLETDPMIMGSILVIKFTWPEGSHYYYDALIWNWRSGLLLGRIHSEANSADFTFLDKNHLLLYAFPSDSSIESNSERPSQVALLIYRVPTTAAVSHQELPNADFYAPSYPVLEPVLILELPKLNRIYQIRGHSLACGPCPGALAYSRSTDVVYSYTNTLALKLWVARAGEGYETRATITHFSIFANTNFILEFLTKNRLEETARMTWSQWGTAATRWFVDDDSPAANIASIEGSLHLRWNLDHHGITHLLSVLEFNPHIIRRHAHQTGEIEKKRVLEGRGLTSGCVFDTNNLNQGIITEIIGSDMKTVIHTGFEEPVESTLPYMVTTRVQRMPRHGHWRIHGDYLVGIPMRNMGRLSPPLSLYRLQFTR